MASPCRRLSIFAFILLLAGCAGADGTGKGDTAVVVLGLQASAQSEATSGLAVTWRRYDPATGKPRAAGDAGLRVERDFWRDADDPGRTRLKYHVVRVVPGHYVLAEAIQYRGGLDRRSDFLAAGDGTAPHRFEVNAGETVYLGDLLLDLAVFPARVRFLRSDAGARAALRRVSDGRGGMVFRPALSR